MLSALVHNLGPRRLFAFEGPLWTLVLDSAKKEAEIEWVNKEMSAPVTIAKNSIHVLKNTRQRTLREIIVMHDLWPTHWRHFQSDKPRTVVSPFVQALRNSCGTWDGFLSSKSVSRHRHRPATLRRRMLQQQCQHPYSFFRTFCSILRQQPDAHQPSFLRKM